MKRSLFPKIKVLSVHHQSWVCKEVQRRVRKITSASTSLALHHIAFGNGFLRRSPWRSLRVQVHPCRTRTGTMEFHGSGAPNLHGHNLQARRTSRISEAVREKVSWFFYLLPCCWGCCWVMTRDGNPHSTVASRLVSHPQPSFHFHTFLPLNSQNS